MRKLWQKTQPSLQGSDLPGPYLSLEGERSVMQKAKAYTFVKTKLDVINWNDCFDRVSTVPPKAGFQLWRHWSFSGDSREPLGMCRDMQSQQAFKDNLSLSYSNSGERLLFPLYSQGRWGQAEQTDSRLGDPHRTFDVSLVLLLTIPFTTALPYIGRK